MSGGVGSAARALAAELHAGTQHPAEWWKVKLDALVVAMGGKPVNHADALDNAINELEYIALLASSDPSARQLRLLKSAARSITRLVMASRS
jgi:hypothetical protein